MGRSRVFFRCFHVIILGLLGPPTLLAQDRVDRAMLAAWDDSLQVANTAPEIARFEPLAKATGPAASLRKTLLDLRKAEVTDNRGDIGRAQVALLMDGSRHPSWPWPTFAVAKSLVHLHRIRAQSGVWAVQLDGESIASAAWRYLASTLKKDENFEPGRSLFFE